jgi:tetratricopeptide (TPR) repeat protein
MVELVAQRFVALIAALLIVPLPALSSTFESTVEAAAQAYDAGNYRQAASLYEQVVRANPVNPGYWRRLAASYYLAGEYRESIPAYTKAMELRQDQPATLAYFLARAYARAGDLASGMRWLRQAMAWGYADLEGARTDAAIALLRTQPGFADLLGIVDTATMTRVAGWRYDLAFLARWTKAKAYHPFRTDTGDRFVSDAIYTQSEFDTQVRELGDEVPYLTDPQIELGIMRLLAALGDGHTELGGGPRPEYAMTLPVKFESFREGLFVTAAAPAYQNLLGARVVAFDGHPTATVMRSVAPYISRDNEYWLSAVEPYRLRAIPFLHALGLTSRADRVTLQLQLRDGRTRNDVIETTAGYPNIWNMLPSPAGWINLFDVLAKSPPVYLTRTNEHYWFTYDSKARVVYFQYNNVIDEESEPLAGFAQRLGTFLASHEVAKLIVDMRWNNGGDTFLNAPLLAMLRCAAVNRSGRLFVIIGPRTFSAGLNAADYFQRDLNAIFVGEPTGGKPNAPGDETFFSLAYSKIAVNFSSVYWESGWPQDARRAIAPDIYVPRTFASYLAGDDPAMDAVLELAPARL